MTCTPIRSTPMPGCGVADPYIVEHRLGMVDCAAGDVYRSSLRVADWAVGADGEPCWGLLATPMDHLMGQVLHDHRPVGHSRAPPR